MEQQQKFNEILIGGIKQIKEVIVDFVKLETRLKAIEEREEKFEVRLTKIESILKAS